MTHYLKGCIKRESHPVWHRKCLTHSLSRLKQSKNGVGCGAWLDAALDLRPLRGREAVRHVARADGDGNAAGGRRRERGGRGDEREEGDDDAHDVTDLGTETGRRNTRNNMDRETRAEVG